MDMDRDACYRALSTRDARFDGRLFVGVKTTGIYCRPICPARTPKFENVSFYASAAAAQEAGFRPCLRCRPEISPELAFWRGTSNTVSRALARHEAGALSVRLSYRPPYDWDAMLSFLSLRAIPGVERVSEKGYRRSIAIGRHCGMISVAPADKNRVDVTVRFPDMAALPQIIAR